MPMRSSTSWKEILDTANAEANRVAQQPASPQGKHEDAPLPGRHMHDSYTQASLASSSLSKSYMSEFVFR